MVKTYTDCSGTWSISIAYAFKVPFLHFIVSISFQNELKQELGSKASTNFLSYNCELGNSPTIPTRMQTESGQTDK